METIKISVSEDAAGQWKLFPVEIKQKMIEIFQQQISVFSKSRSREELMELMDRVGNEAQRRGLTEEILQEILNED